MGGCRVLCPPAPWPWGAGRWSVLIWLWCQPPPRGHDLSLTSHVHVMSLLYGVVLGPNRHMAIKAIKTPALPPCGACSPSCLRKYTGWMAICGHHSHAGPPSLTMLTQHLQVDYHRGSLRFRPRWWSHRYCEQFTQSYIHQNHVSVKHICRFVGLICSWSSNDNLRSGRYLLLSNLSVNLGDTIWYLLTYVSLWHAARHWG